VTALHPLVTLALCAGLVGGRIALDLAVGGDAGEWWQRGVEVWTGLVALAVVLQFSAGDPPRRPWGLMALAMLTIPMVRAADDHGVLVGGVSLAHLLLIFGNLALAGAPVGFARVLGSSELLSERTQDARGRVIAVTSLLALGAAAALASNTRSIVGRGWPVDLAAWVKVSASVASTLCDALVFAGGVYLVWLVRPLLGGSLARPYLLLALGGGAFLFLDVFLVAAGALMQTELAATDLLSLVSKWIGCLAFAAYGLAAATQWLLLRTAGRR
jgi:hypothetical protein